MLCFVECDCLKGMDTKNEKLLYRLHVCSEKLRGFLLPPPPLPSLYSIPPPLYFYLSSLIPHSPSPLSCTLTYSVLTHSLITNSLWQIVV